MRASPLQLLSGCEQQDPDLVAVLTQVAGGDEPVAAVVALAADDRDLAPGGQRGGGARESRPGPLHQIEPGIPRSWIAQASSVR